MTLLRTITLPIEITNDNEGRTKHWTKAANRKHLYAKILRIMGGKVEPLEQPVVISITRILGAGQRLWDADSIGRGSVKELIDSFVACRWLHDDGPKWVSEVTYRQNATDRKAGPAVKVEFYACKPQRTSLCGERLMGLLSDICLLFCHFEHCNHTRRYCMQEDKRTMVDRKR